jgi:acetyltransferase-like isoleucine patch superfamily enzyme
LRWIVRNRAWSWWYLVRYWRFMVFRLRNPHIVTEGFVFLGRRVEVHARRGYGRLILGRWVHIGDENRLRCHEGTLRVGDKCVFGRDNTVNCFLDVEFGDGTIVADWVYICDFDHVTDDVTIPIKDQGIVKSPVRIGPDVWIGAKASVLRGTPARVLKDRREVYAAQVERREAIADIARKTADAAHRNAGVTIEAD